MFAQFGQRVRIAFTGCLAPLMLASIADAAQLRGVIIDAASGRPVPAATVTIVDAQQSLAADRNGEFLFKDVAEGAFGIEIRHVGYATRTLSVVPGPDVLRIEIEPTVLSGEEIVVTSHRAVRGQSPVAFDNITQEEIRRTYHAQDVPMVLTESPGVYAYSDNGNGIGYSYLFVRGFAQRRVSVLINGVPLNDPESHEVYWIDLPDLLESVEDVQLQRGVGTTLYGSNSIGGTVNLVTDQLTGPRRIVVNSGFGSYDTRKFSVALNSGLIDGQHAVYGRFSRIVSDGYRDNAWTDLWSYFLGAARHDAQWTNRLYVFGGPEQTHLAYQGIPRRFIDGDTSFVWEIDGGTISPSGVAEGDRRFNPILWGGETDNFNQPQYQWLTEFRPSDEWTLENTLYYIKGEGFYDQRRFDRDFGEYQLTPFMDIEVNDDNGEIKIDTVLIDLAEQLVRRRWVENDFWGIVPRATHHHHYGTLSFGAELRRLTADHWGEVKSANPAPEDFVPDQRYYSYKGAQTVASLFGQEILTPFPEVTVTGAVSYAFKRYERYDDGFPNIWEQRVTHTTDYHFISPRLGITARPHARASMFGSVSYNEQEPTNDEIFDVQDYYANVADFFDDTATLADGTIEGHDPIMKPERLLDFELGASLNQPHWRAEINLFHMRFHDEIVFNGQINDDGVPIRANAPRSTHQGIELSANADLGQGLSVSGNLSLSDNSFDEFDLYLYDYDTGEGSVVDLSGKTLALFPNRLANVRANYEHPYIGLSAHIYHVGPIFIDNSNEDASLIDARTVFNLRGEAKLQKLVGWPGVSAYIHVNNVFDAEYEAGGYWDGDYLFIPAAKRNFFAGLRAVL